MLWDNINYIAEISYLPNTLIYEYDISKANINVLYSKGVIDKKTYDYLYSAERMTRQVYVGKLQRDKAIVDILKAGIIEAKKMLFEANDIKDYEVLSIKNDAVFIINRNLINTKFGLINFVNKNQYSAFYKIKNLEMYYYYNNFSKEEYLHIKGISDNVLCLHDKYMIQLLKDIFYAVQIEGIEVAIRMLKEFYNQYVTRNLDVGFYRMFDNESLYHFNFRSFVSSGFATAEAESFDKNLIDISFNLSILVELQKILINIYFDKYRR